MAATALSLAERHELGDASMTEPISHADVDQEQSEHLRTQFLRRIAHDIASPSGVTMTVLDELANGERPRPELLAMARRSMRRLMRISEHLALVAELEAGGFEPELESVDLGAIVQQGFDQAVAIDGRKDITPTLTLPDGPVVVAADARLLVVIFREVVGNALKLASSRVQVSLVRGAVDVGAQVMLRIEDDGPGFADESTATLGRRFVKRSSARGLGLSLSMAIEILGAHGGSLSVEPSTLPPGRRGAGGAAVVLTLPVRSA